MATFSSDGSPSRSSDPFIPRLYYFDFPGKAEAMRLLCFYAGIEVQDIRLQSTEEMKEVGKWVLNL
jgi:hypothetical protein